MPKLIDINFTYIHQGLTITQTVPAACTHSPQDFRVVVDEQASPGKKIAATRLVDAVVLPSTLVWVMMDSELKSPQ